MTNAESSSSSLDPSSTKLCFWNAMDLRKAPTSIHTKHRPIFCLSLLRCTENKYKMFYIGGKKRGAVVSFSSFMFELKARHPRAHVEEAS